MKKIFSISLKFVWNISIVIVRAYWKVSTLNILLGAINAINHQLIYFSNPFQYLSQSTSFIHQFLTLILIIYIKLKAKIFGQHELDPTNLLASLPRPNAAYTVQSILHFSSSYNKRVMLFSITGITTPI